MKTQFKNPDARVVTIIVETQEVSIGEGVTLADGLVLGHRAVIAAGASVGLLQESRSEYYGKTSPTVRGKIGNRANVSFYHRLNGGSGGEAVLDIGDDAELIVHTYLGVNDVSQRHTLQATLGKGSVFLAPKQNGSIHCASIEIADGAHVLDYRDELSWYPRDKTCRLVVGAGALIESATFRYGRKKCRIIGTGARVGKNAVIAADVPDGATVLPGRTVDGNTVFLRDERGTVTITAAGADCFGSVVEGDPIVVYARELYAARVRASQAEAAKAEADAARAKAEVEAKTNVEAAERAEQRARSAEGRLEDLRRVANDAQEKLSESDNVHARIVNALAICGGSRAKVARAIEAVLGGSENEEEYDDAA